MKTALMLFGIDNIDRENYFSDIIKVFSNGGIKFDIIEILSPNDDLRCKRRISEFKDTVDFLTILDNGNLFFDIKQTIAEVCDAVLIENENAKKLILEREKENNTNYPQDMALMPMEASVIPNTIGAYQGFVLDKEDFAVALLPYEYDQLISMCERFLFPLVENRFAIKTKKHILKYFGEKDKLNSVLVDAKRNIGVDFAYTIDEINNDSKVTLLFNGETDDCDVHEVVKYLLEQLKDNIYAEFDTSLGERLLDVLRVYQLKLSVAESFTAGRVVGEIIKNSGASQFIHEGIVSYSNQSKCDRLGVSKAEIIKDGAVNSAVAYQMAVGLLRTGKCDIALATTGIAGPKSDETNKPVGLCYFAIGSLQGIHTYKYNLSGNREEITEKAKNLALFLTIKNIKGIKR